jgi:predicted nucleic acid-binding protein
MIHLFVDSNILFKDYFFETKSNKKLLQYCENELITIYISEIVKLELRRQFEKEIEAKNALIRKVNEDCKRLRIFNTYNEASLSKQLDIFDRFYNTLTSLENFHILPYKNDFLPDIVDRAINRKKPFTEEKTELKDAIIWKTYADYVETHNLEDCILLTNNTTDFAKGGDKLSIHPDLLKDTKRFTLINSSFQVIKVKSNILESPEYQFQSFISQIDVDDKLALFVINNYFSKEVSDLVREKANSLHPSDIIKQYIIDGQVVSHEVTISECEDVEYDVLSNIALVSGKLYADCEVEILEYNASRDFGEESYSSIDDKIITYIIGFNFDLSTGSEYSNFEITDIDIYTID